MPTSRQIRRERREAERKARKAEYQAAKALFLLLCSAPSRRFTRELATQSRTSAPHLSILVLPFTNLNDDSEQEYTAALGCGFRATNHRAFVSREKKDSTDSDGPLHPPESIPSHTDYQQHHAGEDRGG